MDKVKEFVEIYNNTADLARQSGLNRSYIYKVLNGEQMPGMKFINGMIKAGMPKEDIFK